MPDLPDLPDDPFSDPDGDGDDANDDAAKGANPFSAFGLPDELSEGLAQMMEQFGGTEAMQQMQQMFQQRTDGPVNWELAERVALQLAAEGDRSPTIAEVERATTSQQLAEHWLDEGSLPAPPAAGRFQVATRQEWVNAALRGLAPLLEPVAAAATRSMSEVARTQIDELGLGDMLSGLLGSVTGGVAGGLDDMLAPMGANLMGMQAGQVLGQLACQLIGQYELGLPTAAHETAFHIAVNAADLVDSSDVDATEIALVLALHEGATRRQYHAVPWLAGHVRSLIVEFADNGEVDVEGMMRMSQELAVDLDADDPEAMAHALEKASAFQARRTPEQDRILQRLQGVILLLQAWARREVRHAAAGRLPSLDRIEEVVRRHRVAQGDGEQALAQLLGLDLRPEDESIGDRFVAAVEEARGTEGLRRALAHPENLPDSHELTEPSNWLIRMAAGEGIPDDPSALFGDSEAPRELSAAERAHLLDATRDDPDGEPEDDPDDQPEDDPDDQPEEG